MKTAIALLALLVVSQRLACEEVPLFTVDPSMKEFGTGCKVIQGDYYKPLWYKPALKAKGLDTTRLFRIGRQLVVSFESSTGGVSLSDYNYIFIRVFHTGSMGKGEYTQARVTVNDNIVVDNYVAGNHLSPHSPDVFAVPRAFLGKKENSLVFSLSGLGQYVWWIEKIEAYTTPEQYLGPTK